jgi:N-acyl amino acid synthase of PEP-CTERM/exosortase system
MLVIRCACRGNIPRVANIHVSEMEFYMPMMYTKGQSPRPAAPLPAITQRFSRRLPPNSSLYDFYNSTFEGVVADTEELKQECYRIRYQVYCIENDWLTDTNQHGNENIESDEYDKHSAQGLLRHRLTGLYIGTVRLILHPKSETKGCFPTHKLAAENNIDLPPFFPLENGGEVSRFCISTHMRRRVEDTIERAHYTPEELTKDRRRVIPAMSLGLYGLLVQMSAENNVTQWYAEMEPFLLRMQTKLGIHSNAIGPLIDFHGKRQICQTSVNALLNRCRRERPDIYSVITNKGEYRTPSALTDWR